MTTDFSDYLMSDKLSATSYSNTNPRTAEDSAYSTHRTSSSPTAIIDSGTSSHIHSKRDDFSSLDTSTSHNIKGFGGAQSHVVGHGTALIEVRLPSGQQTHIKLNKSCYIPHSSPTLLSISRLDEDNFYTLFGNRRCVRFPMNDKGRLMQQAIIRPNISCTGT